MRVDCFKHFRWAEKFSPLLDCVFTFQNKHFSGSTERKFRSALQRWVLTDVSPCHEGNQAVVVEPTGMFFVEFSSRLVVELDSRLLHNFEAVLFDDPENVMQCHRVFDCVGLNHRKSQHREKLTAQSDQNFVYKMNFDTQSTSTEKGASASIKTCQSKLFLFIWLVTRNVTVTV